MPSCPSALIQWQHGRLHVSPDSSNFSLSLVPIASDGRQLTSAPCKSNRSTLMRYNQTVSFSSWSVNLDRYHMRERLHLFAWDGTPTMPMWLSQRPAQVLPMNLSTIRPNEAMAKQRRTLGSVAKEMVRRGIQSLQRTMTIV